MHADRLLDGPALARSLGRPEQTLRKWATDGLLDRRGKDRRGRTLYSIDQVLAVAATRPPRKRMRKDEQMTRRYGFRAFYNDAAAQQFRREHPKSKLVGPRAGELAVEVMHSTSDSRDTEARLAAERTDIGHVELFELTDLPVGNVPSQRHVNVRPL